MAKKVKESLIKEPLVKERKEILENILNNLYTSNYLESNLDNINLKILIDYYCIVYNIEFTIETITYVCNLLSLDEWRRLWKYYYGYSDYSSRSESLNELEDIIKKIE